MIDNIPYYNAPSRWAIVDKIMTMAGQPFSFDNFLNTDIIDTRELVDLSKNARKISIPPLAPPVFVK